MIIRRPRRGGESAALRATLTLSHRGALTTLPAARHAPPGLSADDDGGERVLSTNTSSAVAARVLRISGLCQRETEFS